MFDGRFHWTPYVYPDWTANFHEASEQNKYINIYTYLYNEIYKYLHTHHQNFIKY